MPSTFIVFTGTNNEYYFSLTAISGRTLITSLGYPEKQSCLDAINAVRLCCPIENRYERRTSIDDEQWFVIRTFNNDIIAKSEMYHSVSDREKAIETVKKEAAFAPVVDRCGETKRYPI